MNFNDGNNGWRLSNKKTVQTLVILTILAWATQTLLHEWGFGQEITPDQERAQQQAANSAASADANAVVDITPASNSKPSDNAPANAQPGNSALDAPTVEGPPPVMADASATPTDSLPTPTTPAASQASDSQMPTEPQDANAERFVPGDAGAQPIVGTLELRSEATVIGDTLKLKTLCRWSDADASAFAPIADLVIVRLSESMPYKNVNVDQIRQTLHDAGVNVAMINFVGASSCTVSRDDVNIDQRQALEDWIDARKAGGTSDAAPVNPSAPTDATAAPQSPTASPATPTELTQPAPADGSAPTQLTPASPVDGSMPVEASTDGSTPANAAPTNSETSDHPRTLRDLLLSDLATRLNLAPESLQVTFNPADEKLLNLAEPTFQFNLTPRRLADLGAVSWEVEIVTDAGSKNVAIEAMARAWQNQLVIGKPLAFKQVIQASDLQSQHTLVDHLPSDTLLTMDQAVGQQASSDLKPGMLLTGRMVDPVPLCKTGELITVTVTQGGVHLSMVAMAMESGVFGQTIHARNEMTQDVLDVVMSGPETARLGPQTQPVAAASN